MIRRRKVLACLVLLMLTSVAALLTARYVYKRLNPEPPLRQVFLNGQILTMDENNRIAEAVLIEGDRIAAVGGREDIAGQVDGDTVVTDLNGKTMLPGFIEAHGHFPGSGLSAVAADVNSPPIGDVESIAEALEKIGERVSRTPEGEWVVAFGFDDTMVAEKRFVTRDELDQISTKHPIYVLHISAHMGVANRIALEEAGIDEASPDPEGGEIVRDESGHLTGLLKETAHEPLRDMALHFSLRTGLDALRAATRDYLSKGVTTAQNGLTFSSQFPGLMWASRIGHTYIVKSLIEVGADVNAKFIGRNVQDWPSRGSTALMYASYSGNTMIVKLLIEAGADVNVKDEMGYTALDWASKSGYTDIVKLLKKAEAKE